MSRNRRHLEEGEIVEERRSRKEEEPPPKKNKIAQEMNIATKTGGAYIPPARLRMMQEKITDKSSEQYQRISWEALKKSINGLINKVNISNISLIVRELFQENIVRGRGVLAQSILQAQNASPTFTKVYSALVAIINTRFPQNGELILRRLALQFRRSYKRNRKEICLHSAQFIAHLINQQVAHEIIGLQVLTLLLENPTEDSVEVAIGFLKESGQKLMEVSPRGLAAVMERLRNILHEQDLDKRVQYMIEVMFAIRKDGFKEHPAVTEDLDLVEETDQFTHMLQLDDDGGGKGTENELNVFRVDTDFIQNEENYKQIKKDILDESSEGSSNDSDSSSDESSEEEEKEDEKTQEIEDRTETNLVALRRTIYLAIQSSLDFEECAHKLLKMEFDVKDYGEICAMIIDCCSQQRTYEKFFGLLGARFCILKREFMEHFEVLFAEQYDTIHRLETNKLRNVAKFFGHLLHSDALPWTVLQHISLSEDTTTSSSRIFIKILFQELVEYLGLTKLNQRLKDETLAPFYEGLFPRDNPKNTRFAINFFTSIGLGGITDELREHLKDAALKMSEKLQAQQLESLNMDSSDSDETSDSSSEDEKRKKKKSKKNKKEKTKKKKKKRTKKSSSSESSDSGEGNTTLGSQWKSESESSPERRMKSRVISKTVEKKHKSASSEEIEVRKSRNGASRDKEKKKQKRNRSPSSEDEDTKKQNKLKERLLTFSNTVPNEYFDKKDEEKISKKTKKNTSRHQKSSKDRSKPNGRKAKKQKEVSSSSSEDSSSDASSSDSSEEDVPEISPKNRGKKSEMKSSKNKHRVSRSDGENSSSERETRHRKKKPTPREEKVPARDKRRERSPIEEHRGKRAHGRARRRSHSLGRS